MGEIRRRGQSKLLWRASDTQRQSLRNQDGAHRALQELRRRRSFLGHRQGAKRIILLGYDMQKTNGQSHWHGDHPKGLGSAGKIAEWPSEFERLKRNNPTIEIINCSRETALTCFARRPLEEVLNEHDPA